jgi:SAM-dependent methyltransferase
VIVTRALSALQHLSPPRQLAAAARRLGGDASGPLASFAVASELAPAEGAVDGRLLEAIAARALAGARGAVFTEPAEARLLAALGLARLAARRGLDEGRALEALLGAAAGDALRRALDGARVLDPACGGGALLAAALALARAAGAEPVFLGLDVAPLAARAAAARLVLLGARARVAAADALAAPWPACDLVLSNPPFLRHEALSAAEKDLAVARSGLSRRADLSAHLAAAALAHAPDVALVWPRALDTARSAEPLLATARARGGFAWRLRSRAAGSFRASIDVKLAVWSLGHPGRPEAEASVPLAALAARDLVALAAGAGTPRLRPLRPAGAAAAAARVRDACEVRFGMKSGANAFFHLRPLGDGRLASALAGEVRLDPGDAHPILATLKEAEAPERFAPRGVLFRPERLGAAAAAYVARGEAAGVHLRPTCAARSPWWRVAPGRAPAPVLYPAKMGARAFAVVNAAGVWEDKKWHALFPRSDLPPWLVALALSATPVRLAVDRAARQLTGAQAIADVDCRVLAAAPFPAPAALPRLAAPLAPCRAALARDPVTTDLAAALARPAQRELDRIVGEALGLTARAVEAARRELLERVAARLSHAQDVRRRLAAG